MAGLLNFCFHFAIRLQPFSLNNFCVYYQKVFISVFLSLLAVFGPKAELNDTFSQKDTSPEKFNKFRFCLVAAPYYHPQFSTEKNGTDLKTHICTIFDPKLL